jgi:hypothetical protein
MGNPISCVGRNPIKILSLISPYEGERMAFSLFFKEGLKGEFGKSLQITERLTEERERLTLEAGITFIIWILAFASMDRNFLYLIISRIS